MSHRSSAPGAPGRRRVTIIGGGLAGCEAAWQAARRGARVALYEMKPRRFSAAHASPDLAELVCSNSLRSNDPHNPHGLLKAEMRRLGSLVIETADECRVPAGAALAVDRDAFARRITERVEAEPAITLRRREVRAIPGDRPLVIATGPLTSEKLASEIACLLGREHLYFYDAISPIIYAESIDFRAVFRKDRYGEGEGDYVNCPLDRPTYDLFVDALLSAEKVPTRDFERGLYFEGCLPIEVMAERGRKTLAYGPMKPVGLECPDGRKPYAVVQLRAENKQASLYSLVGFQTKLKWPEQKRVFRMIPGLGHAEFARYGSVHRNTYLNAPLFLSETLDLRHAPGLFFAGQIVGVEGYVESAALGLLAGIYASRKVLNEPIPETPPAETALGALTRYVTGAPSIGFQPMNINLGLLPPLGEKLPKRERARTISARALRALEPFARSVAP